MKRLICLILVLCLLSQMTINSISNIEDASENDNFNYISVVVDKNGDANRFLLPGIIESDDFYIDPKYFMDLSRYTLFNNSDKIIFMLGKKQIVIDTSEQTLEVNKIKQDFSGSFFFESKHYLPITEILPWMNVQCYVEDQVLHIDSDIKSYWEVIEDFLPSLYLFDIAEVYGKSNRDVVSLCAMAIFDCIMDITDPKKFLQKLIYIDGGETSLHKYEIYKECFRELVVPEVGSAAEIQEILKEISDSVSDATQLFNVYYEKIYTDDAYNKLTLILGEEITSSLFGGYDNSNQFAESAEFASQLMKYMKCGILYAAISTTDSTDYAGALQNIYMRDGVEFSSGVVLAASEAISALESKTALLADAADTVLEDIGISFLNKFVDEAISESTIQTMMGDTIFGSIGGYLDIIDAGLSLVWPVNDAYSEVAKMTVYQRIQYEALSGYYHIENSKSVLGKIDIDTARESALIFLKTARKCLRAQQDVFSLYGAEDALDLKIEMISQKILEFELSSISAENDAICCKSEYTNKLKSGLSDLLKPDKALSGADLIYIQTILSSIGTHDSFSDTSELRDFDILGYVGNLADAEFLYFESDDYIIKSSIYKDDYSFFSITQNEMDTATSSIFGRNISTDEASTYCNHYDNCWDPESQSYLLICLSGRGKYSEVSINSYKWDGAQLCIIYDYFYYETADSSLARAPTSSFRGWAVFERNASNSRFPYRIVRCNADDNIILNDSLRLLTSGYWYLYSPQSVDCEEYIFSLASSTVSIRHRDVMMGGGSYVDEYDAPYTFDQDSGIVRISEISGQDEWVLDVQSGLLYQEYFDGPADDFRTIYLKHYDERPDLDTMHTDSKEFYDFFIAQE